MVKMLVKNGKTISAFGRNGWFDLDHSFVMPHQASDTGQTTIELWSKPRAKAGHAPVILVGTRTELTFYLQDLLKCLERL